jgi:phosphoglycolate phosphatase
MKSVYPIVLFDLDGTLTESGPGIMSCVQQTMEQLGIPVPPQQVLRTFIGPPMYQSFSQTCGLSEQESEQAVATYRKFYENGGIFNNSVYPYALQLLQNLRQAGAVLCVATSKPKVQAERVVQHFGLAPLMDFVAGPVGGAEHQSSKAQLIGSCLNRFSMQPQQAVMIGDTRFDAEGAHLSGVDFIGVLHGYGTRQEMQQQYPGARFAPDFVELEKLLLTN